jgi:pimeloyl-ACP methyl ester carboxylesterase
MNKEHKTFLIKVSLVILVSILVSIMLIKRFIYFQTSSELLPSQLPHVDINQNDLHARLFDNESSTKIIIFCHGNSGNLSHRNSKIAELFKLGYSVLIFDYSGYGLSKGIPNEQQCYDDASVFVALMRQKYKPEQIILYGESLGGPVAIYVARRYEIPTVILESPLISIKEFIKHKYSYLSLFSFIFHEFDIKPYLEGFRGRVLLLHSKMDEIIPYHSLVNIKDLVSKFITITGGHNTPVIPWEEIKKFIN